VGMESGVGTRALGLPQKIRRADLPSLEHKLDAVGGRTGRKGATDRRSRNQWHQEFQRLQSERASGVARGVYADDDDASGQSPCQEPRTADSPSPHPGLCRRRHCFQPKARGLRVRPQRDGPRNGGSTECTRTRAHAPTRSGLRSPESSSPKQRARARLRGRCAGHPAASNRAASRGRMRCRTSQRKTAVLPNQDCRSSRRCAQCVRH
jgi:hypothetical protein